MFIANPTQGNQALSGAACGLNPPPNPDMPLLTELADTIGDAHFYKHGAPDGAFACVRDRLKFLHLLAGQRYSPTWERRNCSISENPVSTRMSDVFLRFHQTEQLR